MLSRQWAAHRNPAIVTGFAVRRVDAANSIGRWIDRSRRDGQYRSSCGPSARRAVQRSTDRQVAAMARFAMRRVQLACDRALDGQVGGTDRSGIGFLCVARGRGGNWSAVFFPW